MKRIPCQACLNGTDDLRDLRPRFRSVRQYYKHLKKEHGPHPTKEVARLMRECEVQLDSIDQRLKVQRKQKSHRSEKEVAWLRR